MKFTLREKATVAPGKMGSSSPPGALNTSTGRVLGTFNTLADAEDAAQQRSEDQPTLTYEVTENNKGVVARYMGGNKLIVSMRPKPF